MKNFLNLYEAGVSVDQSQIKEVKFILSPYSSHCENVVKAQIASAKVHWIKKLASEAEHELILPERLSNKEQNALSGTVYLFSKWAYLVEKGYYGFSLERAPWSWIQKIDKFIEETVSLVKEIKIRQIKIKFGGVKIYLGWPEAICIDPAIQLQINEKRGALERELVDSALIY